METTQIDGVRIKEILEIVDDRGGLQYMVRSDEPLFFSEFGEIYFSITNPGVVKAWHLQKRQVNLFSCVRGRLRLVMYDGREHSPTKGALQVLEFGDGARKLIRVPAGVIYGWRNVGDEPAILANCASHPHDSSLSESFAATSDRVPYAW